MSGSDHSYIRRVILALFPWLAGLGLDDKRDLSIRSATTRVHLASADGREDPAVVRVGDFGDGGTFSVGVVGAPPIPVLVYTGPNDSQWALAFSSPPSGGPVIISIMSLPLGSELAPGQIITKATTGSTKVTSG
jgi:hypothetical protein